MRECRSGPVRTIRARTDYESQMKIMRREKQKEKQTNGKTVGKLQEVQGQMRFSLSSSMLRCIHLLQHHS